MKVHIIFDCTQVCLRSTVCIWNTGLNGRDISGFTSGNKVNKRSLSLVKAGTKKKDPIELLKGTLPGFRKTVGRMLQDRFQMQVLM